MVRSVLENGLSRACRKSFIIKESMARRSCNRTGAACITRISGVHGKRGLYAKAGGTADHGRFVPDRIYLSGIFYSKRFFARE